MMRKQLLGIKVSDEERALIERAARLADRGLSDWVRRTLLRVAKRQVGRRAKRGACK